MAFTVLVCNIYKNSRSGHVRLLLTSHTECELINRNHECALAHELFLLINLHECGLSVTISHGLTVSSYICYIQQSHMA